MAAQQRDDDGAAAVTVTVAVAAAAAELADSVGYDDNGSIPGRTTTG